MLVDQWLPNHRGWRGRRPWSGAGTRLVTVRELKIDFTPDPKLFPFQSRWFDGAGPQVHYVDEGTGPAVVMFHGNPTWSFLYRNVILALRDRYRCIAMDYPGFGLSERPQGYGYTAAEHIEVVGRLIDHLGLEKFIVVGQDWGGPIGLAVASDRPDRVAGLVFGNTWYWPADGPFTIFSLVMSSPLLQWLIVHRNFFVEAIMPRSVARRMDDEVFESYRRAQPSAGGRPGVAAFPCEIRAARRLLERLAQEAPTELAGKPIELVWAMKDPAFGREPVIRRWLRDFPGARLTRLAGAGHYLQEDAPEEVATAIERVTERS